MVVHEFFYSVIVSETVIEMLRRMQGKQNDEQNFLDSLFVPGKEGCAAIKWDYTFEYIQVREEIFREKI